MLVKKVPKKIKPLLTPQIVCALQEKAGLENPAGVHHENGVNWKIFGVSIF